MLISALASRRAFLAAEWRQQVGSRERLIPSLHHAPSRGCQCGVYLLGARVSDSFMASGLGRHTARRMGGEGILPQVKAVASFGKGLTALGKAVVAWHKAVLA